MSQHLRMRDAERRIEPDHAREASRFEKLAEALTRQVESSRIEMMRRLEAAETEGRVERIGRAFTEAELAATPLLELLERSGAVAERAEQAIGAVLAAPDAAAALEVEVGSPLLSLTRTVFDPASRGVIVAMMPAFL